MSVRPGCLRRDRSGLRPTTLVTDSASYSDIVFGLFMLLGNRFCPRLADLGETRFYRSTRPPTTARSTASRATAVNTELIARNWDDLLRVAGSLKLGVVSAHELMHIFQGSGRHSSLAQALAEYGRIGKTLHLLDLADDELYRRSLLIRVNTGERRHGLARTVFQGRRGQLWRAYREGQEDQLGALGLVLNAIVVWNTRYMGLALDDLRSGGMHIDPMTSSGRHRWCTTIFISTAATTSRFRNRWRADSYAYCATRMTPANKSST